MGNISLDQDGFEQLIKLNMRIPIGHAIVRTEVNAGKHNLGNLGIACLLYLFEHR